MKKRKAKVLFYYPQHFNRSKEGTNPYFDPFIEVCEKNGISYEVWEEPDPGTDKPRNPKAKKADTFYWTVTILRKLVSILMRKKEFVEKEKLVAKFLRFLTFNKYKYDNYISLSGSMIPLFAYLNGRGKTYELQHGVVYKNQLAFFDKNTHKLLKDYFAPNLNFLFWGKGFENCFKKGDEKILEGRTCTIGNPLISKTEMSLDRVKTETEFNIIFSLHLTDSHEESYRDNIIQFLIEFLEKTQNCGVTIFLKHHPRYNNCINIENILQKFNHVFLTDESLMELQSKVSLHVTFFSTSAFEYAAYGIPTYFIYNSIEPMGKNLFYDEYNYQLYWDMEIEKVIKRLKEKDNYYSDSEIVKEWYSIFNAPFIEQKFINLMR